jgi:hypothetical protein
MDPEFLRTWLFSLSISPEMADSICGLPKGTIGDFISRRDRRDARGMRSIETSTKRKIEIGLSTVRPIFSVVPASAMPVRRSVPNGGPASTCPHCGGTL